jgi:hypothetical protein
MRTKIIILYFLLTNQCCIGQAFEWVKTFNGINYVSSVGRYFGDSTISYFTPYPSTIFNIDSKGNIIKSSLGVPYTSYFQYDWVDMQPGPSNTIFSRASSSIYDENLDTIKTLPNLGDFYTLVAYGKDGSHIVSNIRNANFSSCSTCYFITRYDKNNNISYSIPFQSKKNSCCLNGLYTYDDDGNFYYGTYVNNYTGIDTLVFNGKNYPITDAYVFSLDSLGNVKYISSNGSKTIVPTYGKMKVGKDKNLYLLNGTGLLLQKYDPQGNIRWNKSCVFKNPAMGTIDIDDSCNIYVATDSYIYKVDSSGNEKFKKAINGTTISLLSIPNQNEIYISGYNGYSFDCFTVSNGSFLAKLYTGTIPAFASISLSGIQLFSNFTQGNFWYRNDTLLAEETNSKILLLSDGLFTLKAYCKKDSIQFHGIKLDTLTGVLSTVSITGATYQWLFNGTSITGANGVNYFPTSVGSYSVIINFDPGNLPNLRTASSNTKTAIYNIKISNTVTALETNNQNPFNIFPNPSQGYFTIQRTNANKEVLEIINVLGITVLTQSIEGVLNTIDLSKSGKGTYYLRLENQIKPLILW